MPYYSPSNSSRQEERHGDLVQASSRYLVTLCPTILKSTKVVVTFFKDALLVSSGLHVPRRVGCPFLSSPCRSGKNEREEQRGIHVSSVSPRVFKTFCMWFLDEAAVKTEPRQGGKEKGSLRSHGRSAALVI
ncbi:Uncharacterized protein DBV15_05719 [Temnothorax longispinosus]|uniref:Uncharacterized protein n=1 Tax=Temnothorax longispinosus TaxID=300112 RepID=A0A4S2KJI3_9HYME|nr:Uncharacterized protein DBV15_05719 [Temnothorax longispinosus]